MAVRQPTLIDPVANLIGAFDDNVDADGNGSLNAVMKAAFGVGTTLTYGVAGVPFTSADQHLVVASVTDAPTAGEKLVIASLLLSVDTDMSLTFKCETTGTVVIGPIYMKAGIVQNLVFSRKIKLATADKKLQVISSVAGNISVLAGYFSEA